MVGRDASAIAHAAGIVLAARDINIEYLICQSEKAAAVTEYACGPHHCDRGDLTCSACREKQPSRIGRLLSFLFCFTADGWRPQEGKGEQKSAE